MFAAPVATALMLADSDVRSPFPVVGMDDHMGRSGVVIVFVIVPADIRRADDYR